MGRQQQLGDIKNEERGVTIMNQEREKLRPERTPARRAASVYEREDCERGEKMSFESIRHSETLPLVFSVKIIKKARNK